MLTLASWRDAAGRTEMREGAKGDGIRRAGMTRGRQPTRKTWSRRDRDGERPLPCLEVAEFLGDNLADVDAEAVDDPLGEIRMRGPAEDLDVRHSALQDSHA